MAGATGGIFVNYVSTKINIFMCYVTEFWVQL